MKIAIIDGQGGGIGKHITMKLRSFLGEEYEIIGLGTNAVATMAMLKAGANEVATEKAPSFTLAAKGGCDRRSCFHPFCQQYVRRNDAPNGRSHWQFRCQKKFCCR